jgi:hypothetical protein
MLLWCGVPGSTTSSTTSSDAVVVRGTRQYNQQYMLQVHLAGQSLLDIPRPAVTELPADEQDS